MTRTIAIANHKGGVGKTTLALNLAVGLAERLRKGRVLLVDGDSQSNATLTLLDGKAPSRPTITEVLLGDAQIPEAIRASRHPKIDLLPATSTLADCTVWLADQIGREHRLRLAVQTVANTYEWIIIDSPPSMSLVSVNIFHAADSVLCPVDAGLYSLAGVARLQETVEKIRKHLSHPDLAVIGLVLQRVVRNRASRELEAQLRATYADLVYKAVIPYAADVELAALRHRTVLESAPKSPAAVAYGALITEVMKRGQRTKRPLRRTSGAA